MPAGPNGPFRRSRCRRAATGGGSSSLANQWKAASWSRDADGKLDFPLSYFTIIAFGVQPGREYQLQVQRVEIVRPDPPVATVHAIQVPERWVAGQTVQATVRFTLDKPCTEDDARLVLRRGRETLVGPPVAAADAAVESRPRQRVDLDRIPLRVPEYAWGGKAVVDLKLGEARVQFESPRPEATVEQRPVGRTVAEVKRHGGVPTLFINGQPHSGMAWATYRPTVEVFGDFTRAGVDLFTFSGTPTEAGYGLSKTVWIGAGRVRLLRVRPARADAAGGQPAGLFLPAAVPARAGVVERPASGRHRADGSRRRPAACRSSTPAASRRRAGPRRPGGATRSRGCGG